MKTTKKIFSQAKCFLVLLIFILSSSVYSQFSSFVTYNLEDGLPSNTVYYVFKDVDGYLWIATDRGVAKYDGYNFTNFTTQDGLSDNEVFEVYQDSKKRIWFSTFNGIPTIYSGGSFFSFQNFFKLRNIQPNGPTYRILESPGALWVLNRKALYKAVGNSICIIPVKDKVLSSMAFYPKQNRMLFIAAGRKFVYSVDETNHLDSMQISTPPPTNISKMIIKDNFLVYTSWKLLSVWDIERQSGYSVEIGSEVLSLKNLEKDSMILFGSAAGVYEFNLLTQRYQRKFIDDAGVTSIFIDKDRSYWTSSLNNGVNYLGNENVDVLTSQNVLPFDYVSLVRKVGNRLIITSDKFRFCVYNLSTKKVEASYDESGKIPGRGFANTIRVAKNGDTYISFRIILLKVDSKGFISKVPLKEVTYDFLFTPKYYIAAHVDQLSRRKASESMLGLSTDFESMTATARHLFLDSVSGSIFAYGANGLYKLNLDSFNQVKKFADVDQLSSNISCVAKFNDSITLVGSSVSGLHFLKNDKVIGTFAITEGLSSNYVHCINVDKNEIWVGTDRGITLITLNLKNKSMMVRYLGKKDGIFSNEINDLFIENDTVYVATPSGMFYFQKQDISDIIEKPILNIEYMKFNMKEMDLSSNTRIRSLKKNIKVRFTGIAYGSLGDINYRYKLAPIDDQWHYTNSREIEYPSLAPNIYSLSIQCKGSRGSWSDVKTIQFEIVPSLWQRREIQALIVLLIIALLIFIIRIRIGALRKAHDIKEKLLRLENEKLENVRDQAIKDKEIIELEQQALRLHMNPHFIFNAINAIQGFYAGNEVNKAKQFITYFSRLLRLILETSKEKLIPISTEVEILKSYLELFLLRFEDKYDYEINVDEEIDLDTDMIPPMVVQPFVENAVLHGLSPMKEKGYISIDFVLEGEILKVSIVDNGIGRRKSEQLKISSKTKSTGIKVTQMRLKNIDSKLKIVENVEIIDLEENGKSTGTTVILRMPLSSNR